MEEKETGIAKNIQFAERVLLGVTFVAILVRYIFGYQPMIFLEVFAIGLALVYFPFGFYFIGRPAPNYSYKTSVVLGFIYALGMLTLLVNAANIDSYRYPLIADFLVLAALVAYLIFQLKADAYPKAYVNAQFIRIGFLVVNSFIILLKS